MSQNHELGVEIQVGAHDLRIHNGAGETDTLMVGTTAPIAVGPGKGASGVRHGQDKVRGDT